ncbi:MAG: DUF2207 domain-containing protein [Candidatus Saccharimonadales bacterium]
MKRFAIAFVLLFTLAGVSAPSYVAAQTDVNNFSIQNYQIDYFLDRDSDGRSTLKTVETIAAVFPANDQNHGIERAIADSYDGHTTSLAISSVVDENNMAHPYSLYNSNGNVVVRIGDADRYAHGPVTYKLTYTQRDATKYYKDTDRDEFYWDTNGTEWRVPIANLSVQLHVAESLLSETTGDVACYAGFSGSTEECTFENDNGVYMATSTNLSPSQNVTIAVGFNAKTFNPYQKSLAEKLIGFVVIIALLSTPIGIALTIWYIVRYHRKSNRTDEIHPIAPEYIPPKDTSVYTAAAISRKPGRSFSAQLIDFAVRHYIKIYETRKKSLFKSAQYELEITKDISSLKVEEQELLRDIFPSTTVASKLDMASMKNNYALTAKLQDNPGKLTKAITGEYGLRARSDAESRWFKRAGFVTLALAVLTFSPFILVASIVSFICGATLKPLTEKGLSLSRYLHGLEMYIKVAETDRLRMLQSPEGAAKVGNTVDTNDSKQLITLYERVLPYAILFGQEKEWNKRLGEYYQTSNTSPSWYAGNNAVFNAAVFSTAINSFNSSATYSSPASSSSGGSSGGGSSGGGGGGGGGGGW